MRLAAAAQALDVRIRVDAARRPDVRFAVTCGFDQSDSIAAFAQGLRGGDLPHARIQDARRQSSAERWSSRLLGETDFDDARWSHTVIDGKHIRPRESDCLGRQHGLVFRACNQNSRRIAGANFKRRTRQRLGWSGNRAREKRRALVHEVLRAVSKVRVLAKSHSYCRKHEQRAGKNSHGTSEVPHSLISIMMQENRRRPESFGSKSRWPRGFRPRLTATLPDNGVRR